MKLTFLTPVRQMPGENVQRDTEPYLRRVLRQETELEFISIEKGSCTIESETQAMDQLEVKLRERDCRLTVIEPVTAGVSWLERCCVMKKTNSLGVRIPADIQDL